MANLSDAFGKITIENVGQEFADFLNIVQKDAYYKLIEDWGCDPQVVAVNVEGNMTTIEFWASGRWSYENNLDGYLKGEWMNEPNLKEAHQKLFDAIIAKNGLIVVEYKDSDPGCEWLGDGIYQVEVIDGEVVCSFNFIDGEYSVKNFAEFNGETEEWALEYIYGDEVADKYYAYVEEWKKTHNFVEGREEPAGPDEWYNNEYQEE